jgi:hypothetical protein
MSGKKSGYKIFQPKTDVNSDEFRISHYKKICDLYRLRSTAGLITFWIMLTGKDFGKW